MKYAWDKMKPEIVGSSTSFLNTPLHCVTIEADDPAEFVTHQGLNLTPEGEWIAAPGLPSLLHTQSDGAPARKVVPDLEAGAWAAIVLRTENERDAARRDLDDARNELQSLKESEGDRPIVDTSMWTDRLKAIEQWATKPCVDVKLRLAQSHVLKLVRGGEVK